MSQPARKLYAYRESKLFTKQLDSLTTLETLYDIQDELQEDVERWPLIQGTGGARKGRIADPKDSRGKSGSYRYVYYFYEHDECVYLLCFYQKNRQSDLTNEQRKMISSIIAGIRDR